MVVVLMDGLLLGGEVEVGYVGDEVSGKLVDMEFVGDEVVALMDGRLLGDELRTEVGVSDFETLGLFDGIVVGVLDGC